MTKFSIDHLDVLSVDAYMDTKTKTKVKETDHLLQYESQHFCCRIDLETHESKAESDWIVGLVQACDKMYLENKYGLAGSSYWEFHPLKSGRHKVVNDSDGRQYPFYSLSNSKREIRKGDVREQVFTLRFEDHFYPTVAWHLPYTDNDKLSEIIRHQSFWVWLVAIKKGDDKLREEPFDITTDELYVLKTIRWKYNLHMTMESSNPLGKRVKTLFDYQKDLPMVLDEPMPIPLSATSPPHCNAAQSLTWYPRDIVKRPKILVAPRHIIMPWQMWLTDMFPDRDMTVMHPKDCKVVGSWRRDLYIDHGRAHRNLKRLAAKKKIPVSQFKTKKQIPT